MIVQVKTCFWTVPGRLKRTEAKPESYQLINQKTFADPSKKGKQGLFISCEKVGRFAMIMTAGYIWWRRITVCFCFAGEKLQFAFFQITAAACMIFFSLFGNIKLLRHRRFFWPGELAVIAAGTILRRRGRFFQEDSCSVSFGSFLTQLIFEVGYF